jgi:hypothetical protein
MQQKVPQEQQKVPQIGHPLQQKVPQEQQKVPQNGPLLQTETKEINVCHDCGKSFTKNWLLNRHIKMCKGHDSLTCKYCSKFFSSAKTRWKHEKNRTANCLTKENEQLKEKLKATETPGTINITINNITNSVVSMTSYKDETYDKLDTELIMKAVEGLDCSDWLKRLFKITNEYHKSTPNLKITNLRGNAAHEWDDTLKKYISVPQREAIEECFTRMAPRIEKASQDIRIKGDMMPTVYNIKGCVDEDEEDAEQMKWKKKAMEHVKLGLYQVSD